MSKYFTIYGFYIIFFSFFLVSHVQMANEMNEMLLKYHRNYNVCFLILLLLIMIIIRPLGSLAL